MGAEGEGRCAGLEVGDDRQRVAVVRRGGGELGPGATDGGGASHVEAPGILVEHHVVRVGLESVGGDALGLLDQADRGVVDGRATQLQRAGAHGALAALHEVGVAVHQADLVHRDAELGAGQGGEGSVVALAVRRAAGVDRG